jgi:pimeloyl-ACP methyl ester carboxylesterase
MKQLFAASRFEAPPEPPKVPLLILNGMGDRFVSPACSLQLSQKWNLELRRHPLAGHDLPLDDPDWILAQIEAWLSSK